jgi:hypothetical protein
VALARGGGFLFVRPGRDPLELGEVDTTGLASLLDALIRPVSAEALRAEVEDETLALLCREGVLVEGSEAELRERFVPKGRGERTKLCQRLVLGVSGTIAAAKAFQTALTLADVCDTVDVVATPAALRMMNPDALEYAGVRVFSDGFRRRDGVRVPHIQLAEAADLVLVAPASASTLRKIATGACSDLLSLVVAATEAPIVVAPAMNGAMWRNAAVQRNVAQLRADGIWVIEPGWAHEIAGHRHDIGGMGVSQETMIETLAAVLASAHAE